MASTAVANSRDSTLCVIVFPFGTRRCDHGPQSSTSRLATQQPEFEQILEDFPGAGGRLGIPGCLACRDIRDRVLRRMRHLRHARAARIKSHRFAASPVAWVVTKAVPFCVMPMRRPPVCVIGTQPRRETGIFPAGRSAHQLEQVCPNRNPNAMTQMMQVTELLVRRGGQMDHENGKHPLSPTLLTVADAARLLA